MPRFTPNQELIAWAERHGLDPYMVLADLEVTPAPTVDEPKRVRVTFWRLTRNDDGHIAGREEDHLFTTDAPPRQWPGRPAPRPLRALELLAAAGIEGSDATTSLDTLLARLGAELVDIEPNHLARRFGSDAVRAASVLTTAARIRAELKKAGVAGADLDSAIVGTMQLMRAGQIGVAEALDTTLDARRRLDLNGGA